MDASLFSWSGLIITVLVVVAIFAIIFFAVRGIVRFVQRRRQLRAEALAPRQL
ncbi:hypothetical protein [Microbacterium sp. NPDC087591]|jgi:uncharacterized iron-regulated membrane protein|uniref:hypothetical protein n=1 Tax=Microbacterium sp. NPDC087591 TaxID=3364192 RepID=UPI0037FE316A